MHKYVFTTQIKMDIPSRDFLRTRSDPDREPIEYDVRVYVQT